MNIEWSNIPKSSIDRDYLDSLALAANELITDPETSEPLGSPLENGLRLDDVTRGTRNWMVQQLNVTMMQTFIVNKFQIDLQEKYPVYFWLRDMLDPSQTLLKGDEKDNLKGAMAEFFMESFGDGNRFGRDSVEEIYLGLAHREAKSFENKWDVKNPHLYAERFYSRFLEDDGMRQKVNFIGMGSFSLMMSTAHRILLAYRGIAN